MRTPIIALATAVLITVSATALFTGATTEEPTPLDANAGAAQWDALVTSFDGAAMAITVYRPAGASEHAPVPVVLHSHGWSGSRISDGSDIVGRLWDAGFGVVTIDARGHGDSGGLATVHHKDAEVHDFIAILDWIHDNLDWVEKDTSSGISKDIVAGAAGYSYGGAFQLVTASYDKRLDVLTPQITWSDLSYALAPDRVAKSEWIDFLYATAKQSGTRIDPRIDEWYQTILATGQVPQAALDHFAGSNARFDEIEADVLLIQGMSDVLFNLNQAMDSYDALEAHGAGDIRVFTHLTGHVAPGAQPFGTTFDRRNIFLDSGPCGSISDIVLGFLDEKLRGGAASGVPEVSYALENGECIRLDAMPTTTRQARVALAVAPAAAGTVLLPLADGPMVIAGVPHITASVDARSPGGVIFASLVVVGADGFTRIVDDQTAPLRMAPGESLDRALTGVATRLGPGDQLFLRLDGLNEWYAHNSDRVPGGVLLQDIIVTLPTIE